MSILFILIIGFVLIPAIILVKIGASLATDRQNKGTMPVGNGRFCLCGQILILTDLD